MIAAALRGGEPEGRGTVAEAKEKGKWNACESAGYCIDTKCWPF